MGSPDASVFDSTLNEEETTLSFTDSDFYLNLDDVDIGPQIGQGSFSKVYLGRYLGELVAVKKQARNEADLEAYLMRELAVLKHYQHENLLQYIGASNEAALEPGGHSYVFIVTELACGGDLLALLLSEGEVGWKLRVSILTDTARALEFLHRKSLIHRDIKSPNILLDKNHRCKIADFGMTRQLGPNMTVVGTDAYMAPELMFDNPYGTSADMFSFGIVLWETIYRQKAGTEEFIDRRMADGYEVDVQALQDEAPRDANASLVALARELIEQEPDQRPTAEDTLLWLEDLSDVLPEDEHAPREPIDYEALFPIDARKRGGRQKGLAEPKKTPLPPAQSPMAPPVTQPAAPAIASSPIVPQVAPLAPSPVVAPSPAMRLPPKSASRSPRVLAGDTPEPGSASARAREGTSALPPGVLVDPGYVGRRSTMDTPNFGDGGRMGNAAVMRRAVSLQRVMPSDYSYSGDSDDDSDFEIEYMGMNEMFSGSGVPGVTYAHCAPASQMFHKVPESCTHFLFAGCIQGGLRHSNVDTVSGSGVYGNVGGFHGGGGGDRGRRPLSGGKATSGLGGGGMAHPIGPTTQPRTLSSSPSSQGTLGAIVPGRGSVAGGGGGASSATSASPSSNASSFMGKLVGASHAPITRQGYLHKKGKSGLRNWQKRWFVLEGSKLIW